MNWWLEIDVTLVFKDEDDILKHEKDDTQFSIFNENWKLKIDANSSSLKFSAGIECLVQFFQRWVPTTEKNHDTASFTNLLTINIKFMGSCLKS